MLKNSGLTQEEIEKINSVFSKYLAIESVILHGSRAKGNYKAYSDIDLSLKGNEIGLEVFQSIEFALDDLLLPYKVDLSIYHKITNPDFVEHIDRVGKVFYKKNVENV